jgi:hypothetical protein
LPGDPSDRWSLVSEIIASTAARNAIANRLGASVTDIAVSSPESERRRPISVAPEGELKVSVHARPESRVVLLDTAAPTAERAIALARATAEVAESFNRSAARRAQTLILLDEPRGGTIPGQYGWTGGFVIVLVVLIAYSVFIRSRSTPPARRPSPAPTPAPF